MTTPAAGAEPTPVAATGTEAAPAAVAAATATPGGDSAATTAAAPAATTDAAAATTTAATAAPKGAEALFEGVLDPAKAVADKTAADAAAAATAAATAAAAAAKQHPAWNLAEGVAGKDAAPEWFLADKYKTVADQAAAYPELQKKFGGFTGAPKEGKYEIKLPDGVVGEIQADHPMTQSLVQWALNRNMNQETFNEAIGLFAEYEASLVPSLEDIHAEVGDNAIGRIHGIANWAKANLMPEELQTFVDATKGTNAGTVLKVLESVIAKTRQPSIGKPGSDVQTGAVNTEAEIHAMQAKVNPATGKRFYEESAPYRAQVEAARAALYKAVQQPNRGIS